MARIWNPAAQPFLSAKDFFTSFVPNSFPDGDFSNIEKPCGLLPKPLQNAALGEEHGIERQAQFVGNARGGDAIKDVTQECSPGGWGEIALHALHQGGGDVLVVVAVP